MAQLPISNIINVSVSQAPSGIGPFNVNNVALFTDESPSIAFQDGYGIYLTPSQVGTDFGSSSKTFALASEIFAQSPNILAGSGSLIVIPLFTNLDAVVEVQHVAFSSTPVSGAFELAYGAEVTGSIAYNASAADVQTALRLLAGLSSVTVTGTIAGGLVITFTGVSGDFPALTVPLNTLKNSGASSVTVNVSITTHGVAAGSTETLLAAILRTQGVVSYCGVMKENTYVAYELIVAARYIQTQNLILGVVSYDPADVAATTGIFWQIQQAGLSQTRCLLYIGEGTYDDSNLMCAAYMGRGFSTAFDGSNTTQNMQLKTLIGITADAGMTQTIYGLCQTAGVDVYASFQGTPKVATSGENRFFDQVYNQMWFTTQVSVAVFNALAQTNTKLPQTEQGVSVMKSAIQRVCEQAKANLYCAPGSWTGDTFGSQQDFLRNILSIGYYIYSQPITQQSTAARNARIAPLIQIALKEAGAINTGNILVNINA